MDERIDKTKNRRETRMAYGENVEGRINERLDQVGRGLHPDGYRETEPRNDIPSGIGQATNTCYSPEAWLNELFRYHLPRLEQQTKYAAIRSAAKHFAEVVMTNVPPCADQQDAIRKIREAVMTANAGIALDGRC